MVVGVCTIVLSIEGASSLKEKRQVVKSIIQRLRAKFNASVAEVGYNDMWKNAAIGVSCVSNETSHVDSMMSAIVNYVENDGRAFLVDYSTEVIHFA